MPGPWWTACDGRPCKTCRAHTGHRTAVARVWERHSPASGTAAPLDPGGEKHNIESFSGRAVPSNPGGE